MLCARRPQYRSEAFLNDRQTDMLRCPQDQTLTCRKPDKSGASAAYRAHGLLLEMDRFGFVEFAAEGFGVGSVIGEFELEEVG